MNVRQSPRPFHVSILVLVAAGGALGACARYALGEQFPGDATEFPWTTFAINVTGSFVLAGLPVLSVVRRSHYLPPLLGTGALGGFTTLSTCSEQTRALVSAGAVGTATAYVVGSVVVSLVAVALADTLSRPDDRLAFESEEGDL